MSTDFKINPTFIPFALPLFGSEEKEAVAQALDSGWVTLGPKVKQFEDEIAAYVGAKYAVGVTSWTAGMHLVLKALGIGENDEVIVPIFTFVATSNPILHVGAKPVFVDINPQTLNMDENELEAKITSKTKAIVPVHYAGAPANMDKILEIAKKHNIQVIEDAAHAIGTKYNGKMIGSLGTIAIYSFHPIKNITTGDGGMVVTDDPKLAEKISQLRLHGMSKDAWKRHSAAGSWQYDITAPGFKYNMTDIAATIGICQLKKLEGFIQKREEIATIYDTAFASNKYITPPYASAKNRNARNLYTIQIDFDNLNINRDNFIEELKKLNIGANAYFTPINHFTAYKDLGYDQEIFKNAEAAFKKIVSIPIYPKMTLDDAKYVASAVLYLVQKNQK